MKLVKWLLIATFSIALILVAATLWLLFGLDPNTFKPEIQRLAKEQNIQLEIRGDLDWTLWPTIALQIGEIQLSAPAQGITQLSWRQAQLSLDRTALLQRQLLFNSIAIDRAQLEALSASGAGTAALAPAATAELDAVETGSLPFTLAVKRFNLSDSRVVIANPQQPEAPTSIAINTLATEKLSLDGEPFPVNLDITLQPGGDNPLQLAGSAEIAVKQQDASFSSDDLQLRYAQTPALAIRLAGSFKGTEQSLLIDRFTASNDYASVQGKLSAGGLQDKPLLKGELSASSDNLAGLAKSLQLSGNAPPFTTANLEAAFTASPEKITLSKFSLAVDQQTLRGSGYFQQAPTRELELLLTGSSLNLDALPGATQHAEADSTPLLAPLLGPLALLEGGKGHVELSLPAVTSRGVTVEEAHLNLFANNNVVRISDLSGSVFDGSFQVKSRIDLRRENPLLTIDAQLEQLDLLQTFDTLGDVRDFQGTLTLNFKGSSAGQSLDAIRSNAKGNGSFTISEPVLKSLNIEQTLCDIAAQVNPKYGIEKTWPEQTQFDTIDGTFQLNGHKLQLASLTTSVGNIAVNATGKVELLEQQLNLLATSRLSELKTSAEGCTVSRRLVNQNIPIQCSGSYTEGGELGCRPERQWVNQFVQNILLQELQDRFFKQDRPKEESADLPSADRTDESSSAQDAEQTTEEQPRDLRREAVESLLRGILGGNSE